VVVLRIYTLFDGNVWMLYSSLAMHYMFCGCHGEAHCQNEHTRRVDDCDNVVESDLFED